MLFAFRFPSRHCNPTTSNFGWKNVQWWIWHCTRTGLSISWHKWRPTCQSWGLVWTNQNYGCFPEHFSGNPATLSTEHPQNGTLCIMSKYGNAERFNWNSSFGAHQANNRTTFNWRVFPRWKSLMLEMPEPQSQGKECHWSPSNSSSFHQQKNSSQLAIWRYPKSTNRIGRVHVQADILRVVWWISSLVSLALQWKKLPLRRIPTVPIFWNPREGLDYWIKPDFVCDLLKNMIEENGRKVEERREQEGCTVRCKNGRKKEFCWVWAKKKEKKKNWGKERKKNKGFLETTPRSDNFHPSTLQTSFLPLHQENLQREITSHKPKYGS